MKSQLATLFYCERASIAHIQYGDTLGEEELQLHFLVMTFVFMLRWFIFICDDKKATSTKTHQLFPLNF